MTAKYIDQITDDEEIPKVYARFDPAFKNSNYTLSNDNFTATTSASLGNIGIYLDVIKTSGKWMIAFEADADSDNRITMGVATVRTLNNTIGAFSKSIGMSTLQTGGKRMSDGVVTNNYVGSYWHIYAVASAPATEWVPMVIDFDNRQILCLNPAGDALLASNAAAFTGQLYVGMSFNVGGYSDWISLNSGQLPFPAEFLAAVEAYETANSVTINRGLWA